jgi:GTP-binding protein Era
MVEIGELKDEAFFNKIIHSKFQFCYCLNKIDNSNQEQLEQQVAFGQKVPNAEIYQRCKILMFLKFSKNHYTLPESPAYYPDKTDG